MESKVPPVAPSTDPLAAIVALISELPTESAMREMSKGRMNGSVRQLVETMALHKMEIVGAIAAIARREHLAMAILEQHYNLEEIQKKFVDIDWASVNVTFDERKKD